MTISAIDAARARRAANVVNISVQEQVFVQQVATSVHLLVRQRALLAATFLQTKIVKNISKSVKVAAVSTSSTGKVVKKVRIVRSKPGEYPRADTTNLMKSIFVDVVEIEKNVVEAYVGTPVWYALPLELKHNRAFLKRTLMEQLGPIQAIFKGGRP